MLLLSFIKINGNPIGLRVSENGKPIYEDMVSNHSQFEYPWNHCLHKLNNYISRVRHNEILTFSAKVRKYLCAQTVLGNLNPCDLQVCKRSLFHKPMVVADLKEHVPSGFDSVMITNGTQTYYVFLL